VPSLPGLIDFGVEFHFLEEDIFFTRTGVFFFNEMLTFFFDTG